MDFSAATSLANLNVTNSAFQGQLFGSNTWAAGVTGWRPTRILVMAKQSSLLGSTTIQMCQADAHLNPTSTVLAQTSVLGSALGAGYGWFTFSPGPVDRIAPSAAACLLFQGTVSLPNSMTLQGNAGAGLLQSSNAGSTWSYSSTTGLQSQLYGKLTRTVGTQYVVSKYVTAETISIRPAKSTNPTVQTTVQTLNHPEMLAAFWELKFNADPTTLDVNGDGTYDWSVRGGGAFSVANLVNLTWQAAGNTLDSQPGDNFARTTVVDLRFRATATGSWAGFNINAARSGSTCAPVLARIALQPDGTQTLTVWRKLNDATTDTLLSVPGLPATPVDLHLIIEPVYSSVGITINTVQYGTFGYTAFASSDPSQSASLSSSGSAEFSYVRIREILP